MKGITSATEFKAEYFESEITTSVLRESHCHTQFELIAVTKGDVSVMHEGERYRLTGGQIILIPPLSYHTVTANGADAYHRVTVLFDPSQIPSVLQPTFGELKKSAAIFFSPHAQKLKEICQKESQDFYAPLLQSIMIQIFYEALPMLKSAPKESEDDFLKNALLYIDGHLHEKISLDDLAHHTARSKSSFCHLFEKKMNVSPKQYILQKKLAVAKKMIDEGVPYTTAAIQVGYENYSNFYRLYKKYNTSEK